MDGLDDERLKELLLPEPPGGDKHASALADSNNKVREARIIDHIYIYIYMDIYVYTQKVHRMGQSGLTVQKGLSTIHNSKNKEKKLLFSKGLLLKQHLF